MSSDSNMNSSGELKMVILPQMLGSLLEKLGVISRQFNKGFQRDIFQREVQRTVERFDDLKKDFEKEQKEKDARLKAQHEIASFASKQKT